MILHALPAFRPDSERQSGRSVVRTQANDPHPALPTMVFLTYLLHDQSTDAYIHRARISTAPFSEGEACGMQHAAPTRKTPGAQRESSRVESRHIGEYGDREKKPAAWATATPQHRPNRTPLASDTITEPSQYQHRTNSNQPERHHNQAQLEQQHTTSTQPLQQATPPNKPQQKQRRRRRQQESPFHSFSPHADLLRQLLHQRRQGVPHRRAQAGELNREGFHQQGGHGEGGVGGLGAAGLYGRPPRFHVLDHETVKHLNEWMRGGGERRDKTRWVGGWG